jgi:2-polyprenyl-3-methyl-5-hydroxy-6-metoxy-1,4-benzoquinol methylase
VNIPYRRLSEYIPVDVDRLRPQGSYKALIEKRTHAIDGLVARHGRIPADLLIERACPTCGSRRHRAELEKDHLALVRCDECDLVFVNPAFDETHYRAMYSSDEYQEIMRDLGIASHDYRVARFGVERVEIMAGHLHNAGPRPRYLDVGCSTGFVVEAARDRGWEAIGIDLNPSAVEFGRSRGLDLRHAAIEDGGFEAGAFDAVSLFEVLEHLLEPVRILRMSAALLEPGGILFLYVPNYDSASRILMGRDAHFIWPTHHLNYYSPATIANLLARCGLEIEMLKTEGLDFADYLWHRREVAGEDVSAIAAIADRLQFFANAGCYGKNLRVLARKVES